MPAVPGGTEIGIVKVDPPVGVTEKSPGMAMTCACAGLNGAKATAVAMRHTSREARLFRVDPSRKVSRAHDEREELTLVRAVLVQRGMIVPNMQIANSYR